MESGRGRSHSPRRFAPHHAAEPTGARQRLGVRQSSGALGAQPRYGRPQSPWRRWSHQGESGRGRPHSPRRFAPHHAAEPTGARQRLGVRQSSGALGAQPRYGRPQSPWRRWSHQGESGRGRPHSPRRFAPHHAAEPTGARQRLGVRQSSGALGAQPRYGRPQSPWRRWSHQGESGRGRPHLHDASRHITPPSQPARGSVLECASPLALWGRNLGMGGPNHLGGGGHTGGKAAEDSRTSTTLRATSRHRANRRAAASWSAPVLWRFGGATSLRPAPITLAEMVTPRGKRQRTAALHDASRPITPPSQPARGSVLECASPLALWGRNLDTGGPNHLGGGGHTKGKAAEDDRTPRRFAPHHATEPTGARQRLGVRQSSLHFTRFFFLSVRHCSDVCEPANHKLGRRGGAGRWLYFRLRVPHHASVPGSRPSSPPNGWPVTASCRKPRGGLGFFSFFLTSNSRNSNSSGV